MSKSTLTGIIALLIIAGGIGYVLFSGNTPVGDVADRGSQTATLAELFKSGSNQRCTFSYSDNASDSTGTVYFADGKMRGEFQAIAKAAGSANVSSNMIVDGEYTYIWTSETNQGVKMKNAESGLPEVTESQEASFSFDQSYDYNCENWTADTSKFALPADVVFSDLSSLIGEAVPGNGTDISAQCAVCDQIPDEEGKVECKTALNCK